MTTEAPVNVVTPKKNPTIIRLHERDNVLVTMDNVAAAATVGDGITANAPIPRGHKIAARAMQHGERVIRYGQTIGVATSPIAAGDHVHTHNMAMTEITPDYAFGEDAQAVSAQAGQAGNDTFKGYQRANGRVGTRNYVGIVTSVNCSATVARLIAREAEQANMLAQYPHVDGIVPIVHGAGCGHASNDEPFYKLQRAIWGYATHPNFAATLVVGLGCESNQISLMLKKYGQPAADSFNYFTLQQQGGTRKSVDDGLKWLEQSLAYANRARRQTLPASNITVALQCGGSDGFSGITANPALGVAADRLIQNGGCAVLAETPEIYGAEHLLTRRAQSAEVGKKLVGLIKWWEDYVARHNGAMNNNPSPGNKAGGLTTILEKSLGAVAKGGSTNLTGVYQYGEMVTGKGLVFMDSPGYDPASITGQVASGCNIVCFTTGRGSCYGNKPVPSIKIASNTSMYKRMRDDMDINCGGIADGIETVEQAGQRIYQEILATASGGRTRSEQLGVGDAEFVPWQTYAQM